jgi:hypothetical protein
VLKKLRLDDDIALTLPLPPSPFPSTPDVSVSMEDYVKEEFAFVNFGNFDRSEVSDAEMNAFWDTLVDF